MKNEKYTREICEQYEGISKAMKNGEIATIILFKCPSNIDVKFDNGVIKKWVSYNKFVNGELRSQPRRTEEAKYKQLEGKSIQLYDGVIATCIEAKSRKNLIIQLSNGKILSGITCERFFSKEFKKEDSYSIKIEELSNKYSIQRENIEGQTSVASNGMSMKIIKYRNADDIDIEFEDGTIVEHKSYECFKKGIIRNPNYFKNKRTNEYKLNKNGRLMKIIEYRSSTDIDVEFEDGTIVKHKSYFEFKNGIIILDIDKNKANERLHEQQIKHDMIIKIKKYSNSRDIDVEFEDGTIVEHREYQEFKSNSIKYPKFTRIQLAYMYKDTKYFYCYCKKCGFKDILPMYKLKEHNCNID